MAKKSFFVPDGLKIKGDTLLNGASYTDTALAKLHVKSAANGTGANLNNVNGLLIENSGTSNTSYALKLATGSGNILNISNAGNVGIGTLTANSILHVVGPAAAPTSLAELDTNSTAQFQSDTSNTDSLYIAEAASGAIIQVTDGTSNSSTGKPLLLNPYGSNVGLGTTDTSARLTVSGNVSASGIMNGATCVTSPLVCGTTKACSPIVGGSTCVDSPLVCGTTTVCTPYVKGSTCVCSPIVNG